MKKPGGLAVMIGMGPSKKGGSVLGVPGKDEPMTDSSADMTEMSAEKKTYGKQLLRAIEARDPNAIFAAIENIVSCCGEGEEEEMEVEE